jgi:TolA-binding protein
MISNCLTYDQLKAYSEHTLAAPESEQLYMHISTCGMCACAVNGFSAISFTSDDLVAIHREIDVKANPASAKPLTMAQVFIVLLSVASVFSVYYLTDKPAEVTIKTNKAVNHVHTCEIPSTDEKKTESQKEISAVVKTFKKVLRQKQQKKFEHRLGTAEQLITVSPISIVLEAKPEAMSDDVVLAPSFNSTVIYIYDLKITDYNKLYFGRPHAEGDLFKTHVPVFKENRDDIADNSGPEVYILPADRVLKDALAAFNKQRFKKALENFSLLLENNPSDINAQFYAGLCQYHLGKYDQSSVKLAEVLKKNNNTFFFESQWYLALSRIKSGNRAEAKELLRVISGEKGFYAKKAEGLLKRM